MHVMINFPNWHSQRQAITASFTAKNLKWRCDSFEDELRRRRAPHCATKAKIRRHE